MIPVARTAWKKLKPSEGGTAMMRNGKLTRAGALADARVKLGELATISSDERMPRLVWVIGQFHQTVGRGKTWEEALRRSRVPKKKETISGE